MFARSWKRLKDRRRRREWRRESMRAMGIPSFGRILQRETDDSLANPSSISDGADGKESPCMQETRVQSLGQEDPLEKGMASHFSIFACHGQRSLVGYSPQGRKESETAERLTHRHTHALSHTDTHTQHTDTHTHTPYQPRALVLTAFLVKSCSWQLKTEKSYLNTEDLIIGIHFTCLFLHVHMLTTM